MGNSNGTPGQSNRPQYQAIAQRNQLAQANQLIQSRQIQPIVPDNVVLKQLLNPTLINTDTYRSMQPQSYMEDPLTPHQTFVDSTGNTLNYYDGYSARQRNQPTIPRDYSSDLNYQLDNSIFDNKNTTDDDRGYNTLDHLATGNTIPDITSNLGSIDAASNLGNLGMFGGASRSNPIDFANNINRHNPTSRPPYEIQDNPSYLHRVSWMSQHVPNDLDRVTNKLLQQRNSNDRDIGYDEDDANDDFANDDYMDGGDDDDENNYRANDDSSDTTDDEEDNQDHISFDYRFTKNKQFMNNLNQRINQTGGDHNISFYGSDSISNTNPTNTNPTNTIKPTAAQLKQYLESMG